MTVKQRAAIAELRDWLDSVLAADTPSTHVDTKFETERFATLVEAIADAFDPPDIYADTQLRPNLNRLQEGDATS
jgi:hypothetical protein